MTNPFLISNIHGTLQWYVITGSPTSGKSVIINELALLGYQIVPEAARVLIDRYHAQGISTDELRKDESLFQQRVLQMKLEIEERIPKDRIVFFDRGVPDSIAYYQICGLDTQEATEISRERSYRKIFFLEQVVPSREDYAKTEDKRTEKKLSRLLREAYLKLGYDIIDVPALSIEERLKMILSNL